jgi:hypothetical protein
MLNGDETSEFAIIDLASRGHELIQCEDITKTHLDLPGMIISGRPWSDFEVSGLKVGVPCEHVQHFLSYGARLRDRGGYYKWHSWHHCIVMKSSDHFTFLGKLENGLKDAEERDTQFFEAWKKKFGKKG